MHAAQSKCRYNRAGGAGGVATPLGVECWLHRGVWLLTPRTFLLERLEKSQVHRVQLLSCSFLTGPATKKSKVVRLQLLPCSSLAGPAATKITSSQIAVATLQLSCWTCRPKSLKQSDRSCCPAALLLGLPPQKSQVRRVQLLSCSFPTGPATKKSRVRLAALEPSCWACRHKNFK